jgi:hypothetical protein
MQFYLLHQLALCIAGALPLWIVPPSVRAQCGPIRAWIESQTPAAPVTADVYRVTDRTITIGRSRELESLR